jgi:prepilin-type processing-associated H-X9-DG protein
MGMVDAECTPVGDPERCANTGIFYGDSHVDIKNIVDGTSKTFLIGERNGFCLAATWIGIRNPENGAEMWSSRWAMGVVSNPHGKINYPCTGWHNTCTEGFSSNHPGGAHFAFCDASVHFISEDIDFADIGNSLNCYAPPIAPSSKNYASRCYVQTAALKLGVYQRLAWRNDNLEVGDADF